MKFCAAIWLCQFLFSFQNAEAQIQIDLSSSQWMAQSASQSLKVAAKVPGGIYTDLLSADVLTGPLYYRFNDRDFLWVAKDNWTYSTAIQVDLAELSSRSTVRLECEGLDTVAVVSINGNEVGQSDNMFRRYSFDIKPEVDKLKRKMDQKNKPMRGNSIQEQQQRLDSVEISIAFESPVTYSERKFEEQKNNYYVVPPVCQYDGVCHANHIRKMQASFSWDWGPAFPSMGIWKPIFIEAFDTALIKYIKWEPYFSDGIWSVDVETIFDCANVDTCGQIQGDITLMLEGIGDPMIWKDVRLSSISDREAIARVNFTLAENQIERWWPNGYGNQKLYNLTVAFKPSNADENTSKAIRVAFRELELVQENLVKGKSFFFRVNGVKFFAKGSNWIPAHVLPEQVSREYLQDLLSSAKEVHMNMLRVWGGGIYESDDFYELADEYGILLWHDFMFACSMYQSNQEFLDNVREEVKHQVRRLQYHPSIALWAGNNENEVALIGNWYGTDANFTLYKEDYIKLYANTIMDVVTNEDKRRPFILSSPSNGAYTIEEEGYFSQDPGNPLYGDMHFYIYNKDGWDPTSYPEQARRFVSEYGFQSFPSFEILQTVSEPFDWSIVSEFSSHRQRHPYGNLELLWQIRNHMDLPPRDQLLQEDGYKELLFLMLVEQAESLKTETEVYRRSMTYIDPESGTGMTMGALYWQLQDVWPGASWASLEFGGKWKMSHYFAENMFSPVLVSPVLDSQNNVQVYVVSDLLELQVGIKLVTSVQKWSSLTPEHTDTQIIDIPAQESKIVASFAMTSLLELGDCRMSPNSTYRFSICFVTFKLLDKDDRILSENVFKPYPKDSTGLQVPSLEILSVTKLNNDVTLSVSSSIYKSTFQIDIGTDSVAQYIWLEAIGMPGRFERNGFLMDTAQTSVKFYSKLSDLTEEALLASIQVRSYKNSVASNDE